MAPDRKVGPVPRIRTAVAKEVGDDDSMTGRQQRYEIAPEVAAGRKAVEKNDRVPLPAGPGGVVIESVRADFDELSSHQPPKSEYQPMQVIMVAYCCCYKICVRTLAERLKTAIVSAQ
jgi:hypothetical protein